MSHIPQRQRQRADFLIELLGTEEAKRVQKRMGITDHSYLQRLISNLQEYASIADAPRSGRKHKYTADMLAGARDHMLEGEDCVWSMKGFVEGLMDDGILPADTNPESFWEVFAPYMAQRGLRMVYGTQRLTFAMNTHHASERLKWAVEHQTILTHTTVKDYWFTDEFSLDYGPPPKSEPFCVLGFNCLTHTCY
jgi:hypothetical protein